MTDAEKLLGKLTRASDALRWFLFLDRHKGSIVVTDEGTQVAATVGDDYFLGNGASLSEAMANMDAKIAERNREKRGWAIYKKRMEEALK